MICPNWGQETTGDFCQWCGYPIRRGGLVRRQRVNREAKETEEKAKGEARKAKEKAKRKVEGEAKRAEERAKKEAKLAAKEKAKREAKERAEREAEGEAEPVVVTKLYKGVVELTIVPPVGLGQLENLEKDLRQVENLRLVLVGGSVDRGNKIVVSAEEPIPLLRILGEMPAVEQVVSKGSEIQVTLKAE
jgi:hypothetical protein